MLLLQRLEHCLAAAAAAAAADAAGRQHHLLHHHSPTVTGPRGDHHLLSDVCLRLRLLQLLLLLLQQVLLVLLRCGPLQLVLLGRVVVSSAGPAAPQPWKGVEIFTQPQLQVQPLCHEVVVQHPRTRTFRAMQPWPGALDLAVQCSTIPYTFAGKRCSCEHFTNQYLSSNNV